MTKLVGLLIAWTLLQVPCAVAQTRLLAPTYWNQRLLFIPYQVNQRSQLFDSITKVQLLYSRTGVNDWALLKAAEPNVQGFSFHAPEDGEYWFALRHLDRRGQPRPSAAVQPQIRLVVDTVMPRLTLEGSIDVTGELVVRYEARDANLQPNSLRIELLGSGDTWLPVQLGKPDVDQVDRLLGRVRLPAPVNRSSIKIRAAIADKAGQREFAETVVSTRPIAGAQPSEGPTLRIPATGSNTLANPFARTTELPAHDWPASNRVPEENIAAAIAAQLPPPASHPYRTADRAWPTRTPAKLVGDGPTSTSRSTAAGGPAESPPNRTARSPAGSEARPPGTLPRVPDPRSPLAENPSTAAPSAAAPVGTTGKMVRDQWAPARPGADRASRVVNSRTFDIEYELQSVGPWGVSKVELWGTRDNGQTWSSYGADPDNRSPIRVTVPEAGTIGFRILVDGANTGGAAPPRPGDEPELVVSVDLQPPTAELLAADLGQGKLSGHLLVRWTATDTNLEPRPIALFYSSYPNGPWSTIASGLENTGGYTWRIERHVPGRFYLRLEARDTAGNLATFQLPSPIALQRSQPQGRLRSVRPIAGEAK